MKPITDFKFGGELLSSSKYFWNRKSPSAMHLPFSDDDYEALLAITQNNRKFFQLIMTTLPTMDGWCSPEKGCVLFALAYAMKPQVCVEIGTYAGRSFLPLCWAVRENGVGKVIGIDAYSPIVSASEELPGNQDWWGNLDHKSIQKTFLGFLKGFGLEGVSHIIEKKSDDVEPMASDILHIDGGHSDVAVRDAERFGPKVRLGGIAVLDDIMWSGGAVLRAIDTLEEMGFRECFRRVDQNWNVMQRCK